MNRQEPVRMVSWWLRPRHLPFNSKAKEELQKRAAVLAEQSVNTAIIFGSHFRWDFAPCWSELHEIIAFSAEELHKYGIRLFDHHSSVLTCRYSPPGNIDGRRNLSNHKQSLLSPPAPYPWPKEDRSSWMMRNLTDNELLFLPQYSAREFCMNNPEFRSAYQEYVKRMVRETSVDGLMSDDAFFYSSLGCGCEHCRKRFLDAAGKELPPVSDLSFWGRRDNPDYRTWLRLRHETVRDFLHAVREALPPDFPLLSCCSNNIHPSPADRGLSYCDFLDAGASVIMLEMCRNTPQTDGKLVWDTWAQQMQHTALSREYHVPAVGLGYGFSQDNARVIWGFNKFLGSGMWYSCLIHRLGLPDDALSMLPDDSDQLGGIYASEKRHLDFFTAKSAEKVLIYYSRATLNYGGALPADYADDYHSCCRHLTAYGMSPDVVLHIPAPEETQAELLLLPSVDLLSEEEGAALVQWCRTKRAVAFGPFGFHDETGAMRQESFAARHHLPVTLTETPRPGFVPGKTLPPETLPFACEGEACSCFEGNFLWFPKRPAAYTAEEYCRILAPYLPPRLVSPGWAVRSYRDDAGRRSWHFLALEYDISLQQELERRRDPGNLLFQKLKPYDKLTPKAPHPQCFLPECGPWELLTPGFEPELQRVSSLNALVVPGKCSYFVLRETTKNHMLP